MFNAKNQTQFIDRPTGETNKTIIVMVPPKSDAPVSFLVKALKVGEMEIRVNASIMQGVISDSFKKILKVLPEDIAILRSKRTPFHLDASTTQSFNVSLSIDERAVNSSILIGGNFNPDQNRPKDVLNNYNLSLHYGDTVIVTHINSESKENITIESIPDHIRTLFVMVTGSGSGLLQVNWQYRLNLMHFKPRFNLNMTNQVTTSVWMREFNICCSFIPKNGMQYSNRTVVEVSIPTGYAMDQHNVIETANTNPFDRVEIRHDGTTMLLYFNKMDKETSCFSVFAYRRYRLPRRRPSYIMVQDYYHPKLNAIMLFDLY
ncbi:uncharacterized protein LOC126576630 [Anopheles aquasalis]|uniref:uncharacterized protein LOC126576630 n=1 Tax=Anopheles aquasalis TaxID=42839 RepID=UPI00215A6333|nr:uncharacterized protein LOC126576630 [Anopheles aquasalis]